MSEVSGAVDELLDLVGSLGRDAESARAGELRVRQKVDRSLVTDVDVMIETEVYNFLRHKFPNDSVQGEEGCRFDGTSDFTWLIDPIDGTQQYVRGQDFWGILVARVNGVNPDVGVIAHPARAEVLWAERGRGCFSRTGDVATQLSVSGVSRLDEAYLLHNGLEFARRAGRVGGLSFLARSAAAERGYADSFGHTEVIRGRAEVMVDFLAEPHDIAAVACCVAEAGGRWSGGDPSGSVLRPGSMSITSNGKIHDEVLRIMGAKDAS